ncbi:MAG: hypothetical protein JW801_06300 [Bacteroidales bacterium]|nr:hypothetical protein [Bacteroidales bacterium]
MRRIVYIFLLLIVIVPTKLTAQKLDIRDHYKYWYYRQRLMDEFIIVGEAEELGVPSGLSIPAIKAYRIGDNPYLNLSWIDNPVQNLGRYIGVLSTELALLARNGEPYDQTQWELYCAMKAFERLDYNCEHLYYPYDSTAYLNGLFCRDDVPIKFFYADSNGGFYQDWAHKNNYSDTALSKYRSYYLNCQDNPDYEVALYNTYYPSTEEWEGMLTGLALLVKSLYGLSDNVVEYNDYNFIDHAIDISSQYMTHLIMNDWVGKLSNDSIHLFGADAKAYQGLYALATAADYIWNSQDLGPPLAPPDRYKNLFEDKNPFTDRDFYSFLKDFDEDLSVTANTALAIFIDQKLPDSMLLRYQKYCWERFGDPTYDLIFTDTIVTIGYWLNRLFRDEYLTFVYYPTNIWLTEWDSLSVTANRWAATTAYTYAAIGDSWYDTQDDENNITYESLYEYVKPVNWYFFPLLNLYLHNKEKDADTLRKQMIALLQAAPCDGPHCFATYHSPPDLGVAGWRSGYRWDSSIESVNEDANDAKFPGIDYMIAYNLLWLECLQRGNTGSYFDMNNYENYRDVEYITASQDDLIYYFTYGEDLTFHKIRTPAYPSSRDVIMTGNNIALSGPQWYGGGHTLEIIPDSRVTYCDTEPYIEP